MTDSSIRDIATEVAVEDKAEVAETSVGPTAATVETKEEPEVTESFTEPVDPKSLEALTPQQLLEVKKNWEAAYTKKRQAERKEIEDYKRQVAELQQVKPQPQAQAPGQVKQLADEAQRQVELGNMSVPEYTDYIKTLMADEARRVAREEYQTLQKESEEKHLSSKAVDDFNNADPRLNEHNPNYDEKLKTEVQRELADLLDQHLADNNGSYQGFDAATLTRQIVERRDAELDEVIKLRTQQSTQAAKMREAKLRKSEVRGTTSNSQKIGGNSIRSILSETLDGAA